MMSKEEQEQIVLLIEKKLAQNKGNFPRQTFSNGNGQDPGLELHHRIAEAVEALILMGGLDHDIQNGRSYINILERHTDLHEDKLLFSAILGTIADVCDAIIANTVTNRVELTRMLWGGFLSHYYQGRISVGRKGRTETLELGVAGAQEQQALLKAYSERGRLGNLKAAVLGDSLKR